MKADIRSANIALIEAEVEFRLKAKLEQVQAEAEEQRVRDLARIESDAATRLELAVAEARAAGEAAALDALVGEVEHVRREADEQRAAEVALLRFDAEQALSSELARVKADAEGVRVAAIEEARLAAESEAMRAAEAEPALIKVDTDARVESEAQLVARTYHSLGYSVDFFEDYENGAWLTIKRGGDVVGRVAVTLLPEGPDAQVSIAIKRFRSNELLKVMTTDNFEAQDQTDRKQLNRDTYGERLQPGASRQRSREGPWPERTNRHGRSVA